MAALQMDRVPKALLCNNASKPRPAQGNDNTHCRIDTSGSTRSTKWAASTFMRLAQQLGQKPLFLQENATIPEYRH